LCGQQRRQFDLDGVAAHLVPGDLADGDAARFLLFQADLPGAWRQASIISMGFTA
jgi:hypothetical protein